MPTVVHAPRVVEDFDRIVRHLLEHGAEDAQARIESILQAISLLETSPDVGRPVGGGVRELVIGRASRGYVARYRHVPPLDLVVVLAVRAQRERPFDPPR